MKYLSKNKAWDIVENYNMDKLLYLLIDRYDENNKHYIRWINNKCQWHRKYNLPAIVYECGAIEWWFKNKKTKCKTQ